MTRLLPLLLAALSWSSCGFYSFSGTSIPPEVETFSVDFFENRASIVSPLLSQTLTEKLKTKFTNDTNLEIKEEGGDFSFSGYISDYVVEPVSSSGNDQAELNRLRIVVQVTMECEKDPDLSFESSFSNFQVFDATANLSSIESDLIDEITDVLVQEIFNKSAINW